MELLLVFLIILFFIAAVGGGIFIHPWLFLLVLFAIALWYVARHRRV